MGRTRPPALRPHTPSPAPPDIPAYVIDAPSLYDRPGNPYEDADRHPYGDNHRRFALLGWAAARIAQGLDPAWQPEMVHAHDWHAALAPAYLAFAEPDGRPRVRSVFTIHNLAYQGAVRALAPSPSWACRTRPSSVNGLEFYGQSRS